MNHMENLPSSRIRPECILTGADLWDTGTGMYCHGDLHRIGETFIFNAVLDASGGTAWHQGVPNPHHRVLVVSPDTFPFERRGVIVVPVKGTFFNDAANKYLEPK